MSAELTGVTDRVVTIRVSGVLTQPELIASQKAAGQAIEQLGKARLLLLLENFKGTANEGDWGDLSFQVNYDSAIERIAIVSEAEWQDAALLFTGKGIRQMLIRHFLPSELAAARDWAAAD